MTNLEWFMREIMAQARSLNKQIEGLPENVAVVVRQNVLDVLKEENTNEHD